MLWVLFMCMDKYAFPNVLVFQTRSLMYTLCITMSVLALMAGVRKNISAFLNRAILSPSMLINGTLTVFTLVLLSRV